MWRQYPRYLQYLCCLLQPCQVQIRRSSECMSAVHSVRRLFISELLTFVKPTMTVAQTLGKVKRGQDQCSRRFVCEVSPAGCQGVWVFIVFVWFREFKVAGVLKVFWSFLGVQCWFFR